VNNSGKSLPAAADKSKGPSRLDFLEAILDEDDDLRRKVEKGELTAYFPEQGHMSYTVFIGNEAYKKPPYDDHAFNPFFTASQKPP
jgi:hypothetical protein